MTSASLAAARNFYPRQLITITMNIALGLIVSTAKILLIPFKRMKTRSPPRPGKKKRPMQDDQNIGQLDGNDDPANLSSESEDENSFSASTQEPNADCGWYKKPMEKLGKA